MQYFRATTLSALLALLTTPSFAQKKESSDSENAQSQAAKPADGEKAERPAKSTKSGDPSAEGTPTKTAEKAEASGEAEAKSPAPEPGQAPVVEDPAPTEAAAASPKVTLTPRDDGRVAVKGRAPSRSGATGLDRVYSADTGPLGTIRMRLGLSWFDAAEFPAEGNGTLFIGTDIAAAYTPHELVEIFTHTRGPSSTNDGEKPSLIQSQGDFTLGAKVGTQLTPLVSVAGATSLRLMSGMGGGGFQGDATSIDLRLLSTFDFIETEKIPLRIHMDWGYYVENSEAIVADLPDEPSIIQEFGLQTARYDRLTVGLGFESPFEEYVGAFLEYSLTLPILVELSRRGRGTSDYSFSSVPHSIALGIRGTPIEHLALDAGIRIGLSDAPYTGVPATPPYQLMFGVAYTLDPRPKMVTKVVETPAPPAPPKAGAGTTSEVRGRVVDKKTKKAIGGAEVQYVGQSGLSRQITDREGRFGGYRFEPGPIQLQVKATGYKPGRGQVVAQKGKSKPVTIALDIDPAQQQGKVQITVVGKNGKPVRATITFGGKASDISGTATALKPMIETLPAGQFPVVVKAKGYPDLKTVVAVRGGQDNAIKLRLQQASSQKPSRGKATPEARGRTGPPPSAPRRAGGRLASVSTKGISVSKPIAFEGLTNRLTPESKRVLDDVARGLNRVKQIKQVRIASHVTGVGSESLDARLSASRARAVKKYLTSKGVAAKRLQAQGYGGKKPIASSMTSKGRSRNERIEFVILRK